MKTQLHFIFNDGRLLLLRDGNTHIIYSGDIEELPVDIICSHVFEETVTQLYYVHRSTTEMLPPNYQWIGLRESYGLLPFALYQKAGKASEILHFDTTTLFCGRCGAPMRWSSPISKRCTGCDEEVWPQLNTAIIVLVHRGDEALLVKSKSFKRDFYGLVAGFVETGESLEECVCREVYEETGLKIGHLRYFGSQPWPYPMGLMIGFHAHYVSGDISLLDGELKEAHFFRRDNLPTIPEKLSMARMLIDDWVENGKDYNQTL